TEYPAEALPVARPIYPANLLVAMEAGIVVLSQKCPHLGCRIPECATSQWFECQCHGSQYNRVGEKKGGPAPRGMDHHPATISGSGDVVIDTGTVVPGAAIGVNTTGQEAEGPHCTSEGSH
ncbi:MAG: Rieske 2Fe-2S domain-containing protein, partial [Actinomycetota bacterium]